MRLSVHLATGESVERRSRVEPVRDALEQIVGIDAVVVRKRDQIGLHLGKRAIARTRKATTGTQPDHVELRVPAEDALESVVLVLIHDQHTKIAVRLTFERSQQPIELVDPVDRRDDQIEGGHGAVR